MRGRDVPAQWLFPMEALVDVLLLLALSVSIAHAENARVRVLLVSQRGSCCECPGFDGYFDFGAHVARWHPLRERKQQADDGRWLLSRRLHDAVK